MKTKVSVFQFQSPNDSPGFLLWQVSNLWQRRLNAGLRQIGLTHVQFVLLAGVEWLNYNQENVTQVQLASHAKADVMMTSNVVRSLEKKGLITRETHPTDTRAKCLALTEAGREVLLKTVKIVDQIDSNFFSVLDDRDSIFNALLLELVNQNNDHIK
jgi:DNA-binding MarR family transcriptional regulator